MAAYLMLMLWVGQLPTKAGPRPSAQRPAAERARAAPGERSKRADAPDESPEGESDLVPVRSTPPKQLTPRMLAAAMAPPEGSELLGRHVTLREVLVASASRGSQVAAIKAYWKLAQAVADYHFSLDQQRRLEDLAARVAPAGGAETLPLTIEAALSAADAERHEAKLSALQGQYDLAAVMGLPGSDRLPLPADLPHVGPYRTQFEAVFAGRAAPPQARIIDHLLPLQRRLIDQRAAAVRAIDDALEALENLSLRREADWEAVLAGERERMRQQQAFVAAIRQYNDWIADYALAAVPSAGPDLIAGMLIKSKHNVAPRGAAGSGAPQEATDDDVEGPRSEEQESEVGQPELNPATEPEEEESSGPMEDTSWLVRPAEFRLARWQSGRNDDDEPSSDDESAAEESSGLYSGLAGLQPTKQAHRLAEALHVESRPDDGGASVRLGKCLAAVAGGDRRRAIAAYWKARERAALRQAVSERVQQLQALQATALELRDRPEGPAAMLALEAARKRALADQTAAEVTLAESRGELTRLVGGSLDSGWLWPSTPPHAGRYALNLDSHAGSIARSRSVQRSAAAVPELHNSLIERASAVVLADERRHATTMEYRRGARPLQKVLEHIESQDHATSDFLRTLTSYNTSIADYALSVLSPDLPADRLVAALVVVAAPRKP